MELALVGAVLVLASALGLWWRARNGRFRSVAHDERASGAEREALTAQEIGAPLGERATFVQFSAEVCSACRSTGRVLSAIADERADVTHVELDVVEHLDLVRRLSVLRTPTTLVLAPDGTVVGRMSGGTTRPQALAALDHRPDPAPVH